MSIIARALLVLALLQASAHAYTAVQAMEPLREAARILATTR